MRRGVLAGTGTGAWGRLSRLGAAAVIAVAPAGAATVTLRLISPQNATVAQAVDTIEWRIRYAVSSGDNSGLALISTDLAQDASNPGDLVLVPATTLASGMVNFMAPAGVSNLSGGNHAFGGLPLGTDCRQDVIQIGGGQNTSGVAGSTRGTSTSVVQNVGHGAPDPNGFLLASGSFQVGDTLPGVYVVRLESIVAHVLDTTGGTPWGVDVVTPTIPGGADQIAIVYCPGDADGDCDSDLDDLLLVLNGFGKTSSDPDWATWSGADFDRDGTIDFDDLLIANLNSGTVCAEDCPQ